MPLFEVPSRSLVKTITYRIIITIVNAIVVYAVTKDISVTFDLSVAIAIISTGVYFVHERLWSRLSWGRNLPRKK